MIEEFIRKNYPLKDKKYIFIIGNGEGLLDAPVGIFWDEKYFKIGLNRAFLISDLDLLIYMDKNPEIDIYTWGDKYRCKREKDMNRPFYPPCSFNDFKKSYNDLYKNSLYRRPNSLYPALDLACRLSSKKIPIILIGISFDTRLHFYKEKFNIKNLDNKFNNFFEGCALDREKEMQYSIKMILKDGFDIRYTDKSNLLNKAGCRKINYSDLDYSYY